MNTHTVHEVREGKEELERRLMLLISEYQRDYGVLVSRVEIQQVTHSDNLAGRRVQEQFIAGLKVTVEV